MGTGDWRNINEAGACSIKMSDRLEHMCRVAEAFWVEESKASLLYHLMVILDMIPS